MDWLTAATAFLVVLPTALHGFTHWDERPTTWKRLTPGLIEALRTKVPERAVVFSDDDTSYKIAAFAPVYVANALPGHVADTKANRPVRAARRREAVLPHRRPLDPAPLRRDLARDQDRPLEAQARPAEGVRRTQDYVLYRL